MINCEEWLATAHDWSIMTYEQWMKPQQWSMINKKVNNDKRLMMNDK